MVRISVKRMKDGKLSLPRHLIDTYEGNEVVLCRIEDYFYLFSFERWRNYWEELRNKKERSENRRCMRIIFSRSERLEVKNGRISVPKRMRRLKR